MVVPTATIQTQRLCHPPKPSAPSKTHERAGTRKFKTVSKGGPPAVLPSRSIGQRITTGNCVDKAPEVNSDVQATQFISSFGVQATSHAQTMVRRG